MVVAIVVVVVVGVVVVVVVVVGTGVVGELDGGGNVSAAVAGPDASSVAHAANPTQATVTIAAVRTLTNTIRPIMARESTEIGPAALLATTQAGRAQAPVLVEGPLSTPAIVVRSAERGVLAPGRPP